MDEQDFVGQVIGNYRIDTNLRKKEEGRRKQNRSLLLDQPPKLLDSNQSA